MPYTKLETAGRIRREAIAVEEVMEALERAKEELEAAREIADDFPHHPSSWLTMSCFSLRLPYSMVKVTGPAWKDTTRPWWNSPRPVWVRLTLT